MYSFIQETATALLISYFIIPNAMGIIKSAMDSMCGYYIIFYFVYIKYITI